MTGQVLQRVTVLYDARCNLCRTARAWLERQPQLVPLEFVAAASAQAQQRFPFLDPAMTLEDLTVVGDGGEIWVGAKAWVVCLWALDGKRGPRVPPQLTGADAQGARGRVVRVAAPAVPGHLRRGV
jgi:predicted DCC family thiol-disulfide oxidoreductase YuxK